MIERALPGTVAYYDGIATEYDRQIDVEGNDIRARFQKLVLGAAAPGSTILDFGCGTGTDAAAYAASGHHVLAADVSAGMLAALGAKCSDLIASGRVEPIHDCETALEEAVARVGPVDVIAANYAVLNHIDDLHATAERLAGFLRPGGCLIASLLNPTNIQDMKRGWWWRGLLGARGSGRITFAGAVTTYRYFEHELRQRVAPVLRVETVEAAPATHLPREYALLPDRLTTGFLFVTMTRG